MITGPLSSRARELTESGAAFVTATVVRVEHPTSVQPGNVALVHQDGEIEGFVGGVCAQNSVRLYSLKAIERGEPLLLRILPGITNYRLVGLQTITFYWHFVNVLAVCVVLTQVSPSL